MKHKILLIEDDNDSRFGIVGYLSQKGYAVSVASNLSYAEEDLLARRFDAVVIGIYVKDGKGPGFIKRVRMYDPYLPIIVITGGDEIEIAVDAVRCGADNVLAKPLDLAALRASLANMLEEDTPKLPQQARTSPGAGGDESFPGTGPAARRFLDLAVAAAAGNAPVLITGETGTGKGLLARWIHQNGSSSERPFAAVNCSGLRSELLHAEIFGAEHPAGTGNARRKPGLLEQAGNGTLLLDEIGDMDLTVQAALLRALQAAASRPAEDGSSTGLHLICTSNQELDALARAGSFLPELLSRISATSLRIPPLRERLTELPGIVRHLLNGLRGSEAMITDEAMRVLKGYRWPGNIRELRNALGQGLILSHGARLLPEHFNWLRPPFHRREKRPLLTMSELKEQHIEEVLKRTSGDVNHVATSLGISRASIYRRLKQLRGRDC